MYNSAKTDVEKTYEASDLKTLRNATVGFLAAQVLSFLMGFATTNTTGALLASAVGLAGYLIFGVGIFIFSNRYPDVKYGKLSAVFLLLIVAIGVFQLLVDAIAPLPDFSDPFITDQQLLDGMRLFLNYIYIAVVISIITGIINLIAAYYLTSWLKDLLPPYITPTNAFLYYGVLLLVTQLVLGLGLFNISSIFSQIVNSGTITSTDFNRLLSGIVVLGLGLIFGIVTTITLIVAVVKIYNRINTLYVSATGKPQTGVVNVQSQAPTTYTQDSSPPSDSKKFCGNCGASISSGSQFCENCGQAVN